MTGSIALDRPVALFTRLSGGIIFSLVLASCSADDNVRRINEPVSSVEIGSPGEVSAMALARAMLRAGFTREEILDLGPSIRRSLAAGGGAQAERQGEIHALFSFKEGKLYVTSATAGTFIMDA